MVFTLHRYIFRELFRVFLLATIGLTLILSLGGILQPVQQYGVGPRQVLHILLYFLPITLTFVLPIAALFASALTYGRFASDNELDACRASGIGILALIYPGFVLALLVAIANLLLSFHVMPYFVHLAEKSLKADAKQILFRNIQRRGFYSLPPDMRYVIYADQADPQNNTLYGIVLVQAGGPEGIKRIYTSEAARVQFDSHDRYNEVRLTAYNTRRVGVAANDTWFSVGTAPLTLEFGSLLGDDIKFKRIEEMKQIRADPMRFDPVARLAQMTYRQLATELLAEDVSRALRTPPGDSYTLRGAGHVLRLSATACALQEEMAITLVPPVAVEECDPNSGRSLRQLVSEKPATLRVGQEPSGLRLTLDLRQARVEQTEQLLIQYGAGGLLLPERVRQALRQGPLLQVAASHPAASLLGGPPSSILTRLQWILRREIASMFADIRSETHSRLAFGIGCVPMILIGIGLGILQRGGHLLSAFGASCLPSVALAVALISGRHVTENSKVQGLLGVLIMWGGLAFLLLLTAFIYRKLLRT